MKYGYIERRRLFPEDLRSLCCRFGWYTCGNNESYCNLLSFVKGKDISTDDIVEISTDIIEHSDNVRVDDICSVMHSVAGACFTVFDEI